MKKLIHVCTSSFQNKVALLINLRNSVHSIRHRRLAIGIFLLFFFNTTIIQYLFTKNYRLTCDFHKTGDLIERKQFQEGKEIRLPILKINSIKKGATFSKKEEQKNYFSKFYCKFLKIKNNFTFFHT